MGSPTIETISRLLMLCGCLLSLASVAYHQYTIVVHKFHLQKEQNFVLPKELERLNTKPRNPDGRAGRDVLDELDAITRGTEYERDRQNCRAPKKFYHNRIVRSEKRNEKLIPKIIHVGYRERCLPQDLYPFLQRWEERFPEYSIFLHDKEATERLFRRQAYPEFPDFHKMLKCVFFDGAMTSDIWRVLLLWLYGGISTDIDVYPEDPFGDSVIPHNVSGFYFSQQRNWVTHWFQAIEPRHRMMFDCMRTIIHNIYHEVDVTNPHPFQSTGPWVIRDSFLNFVTENDAAVKEKLKYRKPANFAGRDHRTIMKVNYNSPENQYVTHKKGYTKLVSHPFNKTAEKIPREVRIDLEAGFVHWHKSIERRKEELQRRETVRSCEEYLKAIEEDPSLEVPKMY